MRSLAESRWVTPDVQLEGVLSNNSHRSRWDLTFTDNTNLSDLKAAVKNKGQSSPCIKGLRSICWKVYTPSRPKHVAKDLFEIVCRLSCSSKTWIGRPGRRRYMILGVHTQPLGCISYETLSILKTSQPSIR